VTSDETALKIGELAERTGLTVRTLHHYDAIGLLVPAHRTASGHRLYGREDLERLQRIVSLRQLGLSLEEIAACLDRPDHSLLSVLERHIDQLRQRLEEEQRLCHQLESVAGQLRARRQVSTEDLLHTLEATIMFEKFYTPDQLKTLETRREALGEAGMAKAQSDWAELMGEVRAAMARGADPASEEMQALGKRWQGLVTAFTGGDAGIAESLGRLYREAPQEAETMGGPDAAVRHFMAQVAAARA